MVTLQAALSLVDLIGWEGERKGERRERHKLQKERERERERDHIHSRDNKDRG